MPGLVAMHLSRISLRVVHRDTADGSLPITHRPGRKAGGHPDLRAAREQLLNRLLLAVSSGLRIRSASHACDTHLWSPLLRRLRQEDHLSPGPQDLRTGLGNTDHG